MKVHSHMKPAWYMYIFTILMYIYIYISLALAIFFFPLYVHTVLLHFRKRLWPLRIRVLILFPPAVSLLNRDLLRPLATAALGQTMGLKALSMGSLLQAGASCASVSTPARHGWQHQIRGSYPNKVGLLYGFLDLCSIVLDFHGSSWIQSGITVLNHKLVFIKGNDVFVQNHLMSVQT